MPVGTGQTDRERHAPAVADRMAVAPSLGSVGGIRTRLASPTHGSHGATIHDRPRPIDLVVASQPIQQRECNRSQMPACCQSRRRRQHVIPDPQPSTSGSICHGMPLRRTKRMPVRQARSGTRGRPPFGRGGEIGRNGSTRSHNASGSAAAAISVTLPHCNWLILLPRPRGSVDGATCAAGSLATVDAADLSPTVNCERRRTGTQPIQVW